MRWFGEAWGEDGPAPICDNEEFQIDTPVGKLCACCDEPFVAGDRGVTNNAIDGAFDTPDGAGYVFTVEQENRHPVPFGVEARPFVRSVVGYHIDCFIGLVLPDFKHLVERNPTHVH